MGVISRCQRNLLPWNTMPNTNPPWVQAGLSIPSIVSPGPRGLNDAAILHEDATAANTHEVRPTIDWLYGLMYCVSIVAKPINRSWMRLTIPVTGGSWQYFDFQNGVVGTSAGSIVSSGIEPFGTGWYRAHISSVCLQNTTVYAPIYISDGDNGNIFNGLDQDSLYVWGAQINYGAIPDPVVLTQEVPVT